MSFFFVYAEESLRRFDGGKASHSSKQLIYYDAELVVLQLFVHMKQTTEMYTEENTKNNKEKIK